MKRILLLAGLLLPVLVRPALSIGWFSGSGPDYSQGAGSSFYCANVAGTPVTTQAGLSATTPALVLYNPYGTGKNLVLLDVGINITASPAAAAGFMLAYSSGTPTVNFSTNVVVISALIPSVAYSTTTQVGLTKGQCYGGTGTALPYVPIAFRYLGGTTGASGIGAVVMTDQTNGKVVIPPGSMVSIQSKTAAAISAHFLWREDPQ